MKSGLAVIAIVIAVLCLLPFGSMADVHRPDEPGDWKESKVIVLNPLGTPPSIERRPMTPRPLSLEGKTIYIIDDGYLGGDTLLLEMEAWFKKEMPRNPCRFQKEGRHAVRGEE